jgi:periplasmic protein TonB
MNNFYICNLNQHKMKPLLAICFLLFGITNMNAQTAALDTAYDNHIFVITHVMPKFPGGDINKWFTDHLQYPKQAKDSNIDGTVYVQFIVAIDGSVRNVRVQRSVPRGKLLEQEACRVIRSMPNFTPGEQNGHPVKVAMMVPIRFILK